MIHQGGLEEIPQIGEEVERRADALQLAAPFARSQPVERASHVGEAGQRIPKAAQIPRHGPPGSGATGEPLQVPHPLQRVPQPFPAAPVGHQDLNGIQPVAHGLHHAEGC